MRKYVIAIITIALIAAQGCGRGIDTEPDPRKVVLNMFRAMDNNDRQAIAHYLDFAALLRTGATDYALQMDSVRTFYDPEKMLDDLTKGGLTHTRWSLLQRIVGEASQAGDTALVEVSFIDKSTDTQYYTKFGLRKTGKMWKIFSFNRRDSGQ